MFQFYFSCNSNTPYVHVNVKTMFALFWMKSNNSAYALLKSWFLKNFYALDLFIKQKIWHWLEMIERSTTYFCHILENCMIFSYVLKGLFHENENIYMNHEKYKDILCWNITDSNCNEICNWLSVGRAN